MKKHLFLFLLLIPALYVSGQTTQTFSFTGNVQTFTVPNCVSSITITCKGASGANGTTSATNAGGTGGNGAVVSGSINVTPGQVFDIYVGGAGVGSTGGYNGGGNGTQLSGAGGGASNVRNSTKTNDNRIIVAAGGGGGGNAGFRVDGAITEILGGNGGDSEANGVAGGNSSAGLGGEGAIGINGGLAGAGCASFAASAGGSGTSGIGGNGGAGSTYIAGTVYGSGGGGGGGFNGGGAGGGGGVGTVGCTHNDNGAGGGGAGGTNYTSVDFTDVTISNGTNIGNGYVEITYTTNTYTFDLTITTSVNTLESNEANASYQWVDCDNGNAPIAGETNKIFNPSQNGNYACTLTDPIYGCLETTDCVSFTYVGIKSINNNLRFNIYPNPTSNILNVELGNQKANITIFDLTGRILQNSIQEGTAKFDLSSFVKGIYIITIVTDKETSTYKFTKE
jgi:hypothetical protein